MAEEAEVKETEEKPIETQEDDVESRARKMGWKPEAEFDGDKSKWIPAKEYVDRAPLYDEIKRLRRKVGDVEHAISQFKQHHSKVEEAAYKRAMEDLKMEKIRALETGDHAKVVDIDEEIAELKSNKAQAQKPSNGPSPEFTEWVAENPWYNDDEDLREAADTLGIGYASRYPNKAPADAFAYVAKKIKELYPHKFRSTPRPTAPTVEGSRTVPKKPKAFSFDDLNEAQKQVAKTFERRGVMTVDQYVQDLVKMGELK